MRKILRLNQTGDTLVEVMLATAVLSLVLASAFTLTNKATRLSQTANERTVVSNLMQREAELIRVKHGQDSGVFWTDIDTNYPPGVENFTFCDTVADPETNAFFMDTVNLTDLTDTSYLELAATDSGSGITDADPTDLFTVWTEAVNGAGYTDFFVYACWEGIGGEGAQRSGLVMRMTR